MFLYLQYVACSCSWAVWHHGPSQHGRAPHHHVKHTSHVLPSLCGEGRTRGFPATGEWRGNTGVSSNRWVKNKHGGFQQQVSEGGTQGIFSNRWVKGEYGAFQQQVSEGGIRGISAAGEWRGTQGGFQQQVCVGWWVRWGCMLAINCLSLHEQGGRLEARLRHRWTYRWCLINISGFFRRFVYFIVLQKMLPINVFG